MTGKSAPNLKDVNARVEKLASDFNSGLSMLQEEFSKLKNSYTSAGAEKQPDFLEKLKSFQEKISTSLGDLIKDVGNLKAISNTLQLRVQSMEMKHNSNFVILHGIPEQNPDIFSTAIKLFSEKLNIKLDKSELSFCYRLGKKPPTGTRPRPIVVQFCRRWARDSIFNNKKRLKGSGIIITEMLTSENLTLFKKARELFSKSAWTFNGLVYVEISGNRRLIKSESDLGDAADEGEGQL